MSAASDPVRPDRDRCTTPDGLGIEVYDFGGRGTDLLLVHATGFCAEVFGPLARSLRHEYRCWGVDLRAHGRSDRPDDGNFAWSGFATDVATAIDHLGLDRPAGFGHSCGGAAVILAEEAAPGTFRSLYCFEPVIPTGRRAEASVVEDNPLSVGARRRRDTFPSAELAFTNFSSKPPFSSLDPEVLLAYVDAGFDVVPDSEGGDGQTVRLRCRRDDEAEIYAHGFAHRAFEHLHKVRCPVTLGCGEHTDSFGPDALDRDAARLPDARVEVIPAVGHFGPLQAPEVLAATVALALGTSTGTGTPPS